MFDEFFTPPIGYVSPDKLHTLPNHVINDIGFTPTAHWADYDRHGRYVYSKYDNMFSSDADYLNVTQQLIELYLPTKLEDSNQNISDVLDDWTHVKKTHSLPNAFQPNPKEKNTESDSCSIIQWFIDIFKWGLTTPWVIFATIGIWIGLSALNVLGPIWNIARAVFPPFCEGKTWTECCAKLSTAPGTVIGPLFRCTNSSGAILWFPLITGIVGTLYYLFSSSAQCIGVSKFFADAAATGAKIKTVYHHIDYTITCMDQMLALSNVKYHQQLEKSKAYVEFNRELLDRYIKLKRLYRKLAPINTWSTNIGDIVAIASDIANCPESNESIMYSFGFVYHMIKLQVISRNPEMHPATISNSDTIVIVNQIQPSDLDQVATSITLDSNVVLTGPNASGKTTFLKTTLTNLILTQQFGYGFYDKCEMPYLYTRFQSYLNIPDTNGTDSLFQAEARRCRDILVDAADNNRQFCIFDELFTGTNPEESVRSSAKLLTVLNQKYPNLDFIITTHMNDLCEALQPLTKSNDIDHEPNDVHVKSKTIKFMRMHVDTEEAIGASNQPVTLVKPTYRLVPGINDVCGAESVLHSMGL